MKASNIRGPEEVYRFWVEECERAQWFTATPAFDREIRERFGDTHLMLAGGVDETWRADARSRLAAVIVLDQFPRNIYRGTPLAFATDGLALREAKLALAAGADAKVESSCRCFFYLPFEHAEDLAAQRESLRLFERLAVDAAGAGTLTYAMRHYAVIERFGRFPHRNAILGRASTPEELAFLDQPGSSF
jgi:uncharacterized protein (DUF924 family)